MPTTVDPDIADLGLLLEDRAVGDDEIGDPAGLDRSHEIADAEQLRGDGGEHGQCAVLVEPVRDGLAKIGVELVALVQPAGGDGGGDAGGVELTQVGRILLPRHERFEIDGIGGADGTDVRDRGEAQRHDERKTRGPDSVQPTIRRSRTDDDGRALELVGDGGGTEYLKFGAHVEQQRARRVAQGVDAVGLDVYARLSAGLLPARVAERLADQGDRAHL